MLAPLSGILFRPSVLSNALRHTQLARQPSIRPRLSAVRAMSSQASNLPSWGEPRVGTSRQPLEPPTMYRTTPPPHHTSADSKSRSFRSPWPSAGPGHMGFLGFMKIRLFEWETSKVASLNEVPPSQPCTWLPASGISTASTEEGKTDKASVLFTWIGHAGCHYRLPVPGSDRPISILTDPVLSQRCSPSQSFGPARLQPPPTTVASMAQSTEPGVWPDVLVLSHNHYDHLDLDTIKALLSQPNGRPVPHIFCTLGVAPFFHSLGVDQAKVHELDWWQQRQLTWSDDHNVSLRLTCVPAQHFSGRTMTDRNKSVWAGWTMESVDTKTNTALHRVYFAGDSGYRHVNKQQAMADRATQEALPHCPAFAEIGKLLGPFDVAAIPIGAYLPRHAMSAVHMDPLQAVQVHKQVRAKHSVAIHWGVFDLAADRPSEAPTQLQEELERQGIAADQFVSLQIGETRRF